MLYSSNTDFHPDAGPDWAASCSSLSNPTSGAIPWHLKLVGTRCFALCLQTRPYTAARIKAGPAASTAMPSTHHGAWHTVGAQEIFANE